MFSPLRRLNLLHMDPSDWDHGQMREGYRWRASSLGRLLGAERIGGSLYDLGDGERTFPYHFHHGMEEWLLVIEGTPTLRAQGYERELRAGDVVRFPPGAEGGVILMALVFCLIGALQIFHCIMSYVVLLNSRNAQEFQ